MKPLRQAINDYAGGQAQALTKHLKASGISCWSDCTKANLADFRDALTEQVAPSSAKTYIAVLKAILARYEDEGIIPCKTFREVLKVKNDKPVKAFLSTEELERLMQVPTRTSNEIFVLYSFLVGAFTGMRVSDARAVTSENINNDQLSYVSIKTGVHATIPVGERVKGYIDYLRANDSDMTLVTYNDIIRRLCKRAGLTERVKVRHGGKDAVKEKWECVSSHTARISFCTNLSILGLSTTDISRMSGHSNIQCVERYIAAYSVNFNDKVMSYFNQ
jgi:integrase